MQSIAKERLGIMAFDNDIDGAAAAMVLEQARKFSKVVLIPHDHFNKEATRARIREEMKPGCEISSLDFTFERDFLNELERSGIPASVEVYDHHPSAAAAMRDYKPEGNGKTSILLCIDPSKPSAAGLVWDMLMNGQEKPALLHMIDKMDGDAHGLRTAQEFSAAAYIDEEYAAGGCSFEVLRRLAKQDFNEMAARGVPILSMQDAKIDDLLKGAVFAKLQILPDTEPVCVPVVSGDLKIFGRRISERLAGLGREQGPGVAFCWHEKQTGAVTMSIRSDGHPPADKIARHLSKTMGIDGGGHEGAAAVHFPSMADFTRQMMPFSRKSSPSSPPPPCAPDEPCPPVMLNFRMG